MTDQTPDSTDPTPDSPDQTADNTHQTLDSPDQPVGAENSDAPVPSDDELEGPSTEKDLGKQPVAEKPEEPEPSHHAVGIGVIGGPQTIADTPAAGEAGEIEGDDDQGT